MGSFGGVKFDAENFQQVVNLAQEKSLLQEQMRVALLAQNLKDYRIKQLNSIFPDGEYYVTSDFNSQLIIFKDDAINKREDTGLPPVLKLFKKGELVNVTTTPTDMKMNTVKAIKTDSGNFYADQNKLSKTKPVEPLRTESLSEVRRRNEDKTKIIIVGAFILGFLLSKD